MTRSVEHDDALIADDTLPKRETYVPFFQPCRPCGHCPACGRGYSFPAFPYDRYIGDPHPWLIPMTISYTTY